MHFGFEVKNAEHLHAIRGNSVFVMHHADVAEAERLHEGLYDFVMRHGAMSGCALRSRNECEFLA